MNKKMINITAVIAKILEILLWIGDALLIVLSIALIVKRDYMEGLINGAIDDGTLSITGLNIDLLNQDGSFTLLPIILGFIAGIIGLGFGAMICRNINQILKAEKPFCKDNIRRVREIGIFSISVPLLQLIISIIIGFVEPNTVDSYVDVMTLFFGLVILCLSQFFTYGATLEEDVDGLL